MTRTRTIFAIAAAILMTSACKLKEAATTDAGSRAYDDGGGSDSGGAQGDGGSLGRDGAAPPPLPGCLEHCATRSACPGSTDGDECEICSIITATGCDDAGNAVLACYGSRDVCDEAVQADCDDEELATEACVRAYCTDHPTECGGGGDGNACTGGSDLAGLAMEFDGSNLGDLSRECGLGNLDHAGDPELASIIGMCLGEHTGDAISAPCLACQGIVVACTIQSDCVEVCTSGGENGDCTSCQCNRPGSDSVNHNATGRNCFAESAACSGLPSHECDL